MTESPGGATVRSVRVVMDASIDAYVAKMRLAGRETDSAFDRVERRLASTNRALGDTDTSLTGLSRTERTVGASTDALGDSFKSTEKKTRDYTLAMAIADEKSRRLRDSLRQQAKASVDAEQGINRTDQSLRRANNQLDTFSGRTALIIKALAGLGPALVPLGAGAVPVLSALAVGGGAAAAGLGATILALNGVGDAAKALNQWQIEKTPENLAKVREEFARIGPDGERFVRFLDSIEPELRGLQLLAREGILPGFEEGITNLLELLPELRTITRDISATIGDLAGDAGASLAGEDFQAFFDYVRTDAAPTLDAFSRTVGNFTLAFANLLVGLAPATRDFSGGMLEFSQGLADASANLDTNQGFQRFLAYVQENGPKALDFLASFGAAFVDLVTAAAPVGSELLPILTGVLRIFGAIAESPVGPTLIAAAAAFSYLSTAVSLLDKSLARIPMSSDRAASAIGKFKTAGGAATAVLLLNSAASELLKTTDKAGPAVEGLAQDLLNFADMSSRQDIASGLGDLRNSIELLTDPGLAQDIGSLYDKVPFGLGSDFADIAPGLAGVRQDAREAASSVESLDAALAGLVAQGGEEEAARAVEDLATAYGLSADEVDQLLGLLPRYQEAVAGSANADALAADSADRHTEALVREANALERSIEAMRAKREEALRGLNAELDYQQAIDDARKALKENGRTVDETTEKGRNNLRTLYALAGAWNDQSDAAKSARGSLRAAKDNFVETATAMGMPIRQAERLAARLFEIPAKRKTEILVETGQAMILLQALKNRYDAIRDKSVTISMNTVGGPGPGRPMGVPTSADGGTVHGQRSPYGDKVLTYLAPGEEVISNRHGQADRHRPLLKRINAGRMADGGTVPTYTSRRGPEVGLDGPFSTVSAAAATVTGSLKQLEARLDKVSRAYDKEKSKLESLTSARQSTADAVASSLTNDPFGNGLAGFDAQVEADTADIQAMAAALATLVRNGLDPKSALYQQLAASSDVTTAQQLAALSKGELADRARRFEVRASEAAALGGTVAGQAYDEAIRKQTKATERLERQMDSLEDAIRDLKKVPKQMGDQVFDAAFSGTSQGSEEGTRAGQDEKRRRLASIVRTEGRPLVRR